jgi:hypothetical protein
VLTGRNIGLPCGLLYGIIGTSRGKPWLSSIAILQMQTYKTILFRLNDSKRVLECGLSLEEAQEICSHSNSSSRTCDSRTKQQRGSDPWFVGYEKE